MACSYVFLAFTLEPSARAQDTGARFPVTTEQRRIADQVAKAGVPLSALAAKAPDRYTVKSGDTLWGISSMFLTSPWRWPELWGMNKQQVRDPHVIYPGQILALIKTDGMARLEVGSSQPGDLVRLSPRVRDLGADSNRPLPSIPSGVIEPFLSQPLVVTADDLNRYPRIVATLDRTYLGRGDLAYVRGIEDNAVENYRVFRPAQPLYDPDDTDRAKPIAYEAFYLGTARLLRRGEVTTIQIQDSKQEIGVGDRLIPITQQALVNYVPRSPDKSIEGRVVSVYGGETSAGTQSIVALNRGSRDGLEVGHVLGLLQVGATIEDTTASTRERVKLPDERVGEMFVFRVFDGISYALIMRVTQPVRVGDRFVQAESVAYRP